jgi:hypothetical protein
MSGRGEMPVQDPAGTLFARQALVRVWTTDCCAQKFGKFTVSVSPERSVTVFGRLPDLGALITYLPGASDT